ncbi:DUF5362 family protein [Danxiaibacter flavus]|uniref:DUF5362 family protein n=1 Tax=Danxiaibacter flavus TaxID=3049108 RepID=A0ABV3ZAZ3_9BACT|nr:DUF5362 family protein [Chitinophagaceae bacterium DXS]
MEPNTSSSSLFELQIDTLTTSHLVSTAKWAKFISIVGFVMSALIVLVAFFAGSLLSVFSPAGSAGYMSGSFLTVVYLIFALLFFLPNLFLFNYAGKMQQALNGNDQNALNNSFAQLKSYFRFIGIIMIVVISIYALVFLLAIIGVLMR